ncbi:DUF4389 domain-containing protein [Thermoleophilia bacterium SCSIO 60948]|nr:DUF4389 domain-containing protein [Thermoleophilia bacterium SCSIO 60948]
MEAGAGGIEPLGEGLPAELRDYPVQSSVARQEEYSRFLPLIKWLLVIPHLFVLVFVGLVALFAIVLAFFAVLITGRYPRALFDVVLSAYRYGWRVGAYMYLMTDRYPPFAFGDVPDYPARLEIAYPEQGVDRWRPLVAWLLAFPYLFVAGALLTVTGVLTFFAFFTILFTKRYPAGMFDLALVPMRWQQRGNAYSHFMVTRYPPLAWG